MQLKLVIDNIHTQSKNPVDNFRYQPGLIQPVIYRHMTRQDLCSRKMTLQVY